MAEEKDQQEQPTEIITIEGVGTIKVYGELNIEKLVKRLLKSKAIVE